MAEPSLTHRWQFTIRQLLVATAIVAFALLVCVKLPNVVKIALFISIPSLILVAILHSANVATSDRHPYIAAVFWTAFGAFFFAYSILVWRASSSGLSVPSPMHGLLWIMSGCGAICVCKAFRTAILIRRARRDLPPQTDTSRAAES